MKMLELFSGSGVMADAFRTEGYETITVDIEKKYNPDITADLSIPEEIIVYLEQQGWKPDVIWASPPCTTFSVASLRHYWKDGKPSNEKTLHGISLVKNTIKLIEQIKPKFWFIENPRGMLRKQDFMQGLPRKTVTYCKYGDKRMKPTDIWTNADIPFLPTCKNGDRCHVAAPRGSATGTQGIPHGTGSKSGATADMARAPYLRAIIPQQLCEYIARWCKEQSENSVRREILEFDRDD